jgi:hypothetical protein
MSKFKHIVYGDSVTGDTMINLGYGISLPMCSLFMGAPIEKIGDKEYCSPNRNVLTYDWNTKSLIISPMKYVMRHKTSKDIYRVWITDNNYVDVTEDHSLMTFDASADKLVETKPNEINSGPLLHLTYGYHDSRVGNELKCCRPLRVVNLGPIDDYVYDIEVEGTHTFFANDILVHNTDSCYVHLSAYMKNHDIIMTNDIAIKIIDNLQERLETDLAPIIGKKFITPAREIEILEPGREIVATRGLFKDKKKRYALAIFNSEGKTVDKLKVLGMETKRTDTPKFIQDFLKECLIHVVQHGKGYDDLKEVVDAFRVVYREMDPWRQGSPGRVRNLNTKTRMHEAWMEDDLYIGSKPPQMHFTVKAAINTNKLVEMNDERRWNPIRDGDKVEVIYLKDNPEKMTSVAIPVDATYVPDWFKELPFDVVKMEEKLLDRKLFNVIGDVLEWSFAPPKSYIDDIGKIVDDFYD